MDLAEVQVHAHEDDHLGDQAVGLAQGVPEGAPEEAVGGPALAPVVAEQPGQDDETVAIDAFGLVVNVLEAAQVSVEAVSEGFGRVQALVELLLALLELVASHEAGGGIGSTGRGGGMGAGRAAWVNGGE